MTTIAIIVGAGRGHRFGGEMPKQYRTLGTEPVLRWSVRAFADHPEVDRIIGVIHPDDTALFEAATEGIQNVSSISGGKERQDSARNGVVAAIDAGADRVLIHDAARPFISRDLISGILDALDDAAGAIPALSVSDTLKRGAEGIVGGTVDRTGLFRAQTPQGFRAKEALAAHEQAAGKAFTDDAAVAEAAGLTVALVPGEERNFKITTQDDLDRAERELACGETRTGFGFDVHRFEDGASVRLCGVDIAHDFKLAGHSDADVAFHALTDAILGAIGKGDIGEHFPPTDSRWKGADSEVFLAEAARMARDLGATISNVDLTIICEAPKVNPHRAAMRGRVAEVLGIDIQRVNIKATTTERLGFTGRREGIAAQAVATVRLPG